MPIASSDFRALGNLEAAPTGNLNPKCAETKLKLNGFRLLSQHMHQKCTHTRTHRSGLPGTFLELGVILGCTEFLYLTANKCRKCKLSAIKEITSTLRIL